MGNALGGHRRPRATWNCRQGLLTTASWPSTRVSSPKPVPFGHSTSSRAYRPQTNGKVERFIQPALREPSRGGPSNFCPMNSRLGGLAASLQPTPTPPRLRVLVKKLLRDASQLERTACWRCPLGAMGEVEKSLPNLLISQGPIVKRDFHSQARLDSARFELSR
jgi:hypothetical protein